jgi:hypothetical protein
MSSSSRPFIAMPPPARFEDGELQRRPGPAGGYQNQQGLGNVRVVVIYRTYPKVVCFIEVINCDEKGDINV